MDVTREMLVQQGFEQTWAQLEMFFIANQVGPDEQARIKAAITPVVREGLLRQVDEVPDDDLDFIYKLTKYSTMFATINASLAPRINELVAQVLEGGDDFPMGL